MKKNNYYTIVLIAILLFVFHGVFSLVPLSANDFPYLSQNELLQRFSIPYAWWDRGSQGLGEYTIPFLWVWPMDILYGLGGSFGLTFGILERLFGIIPAFLLGVFGIRKLLKTYSMGETAIFVGTLIYLLNSYFLLLMDGGQLSFTLSYAWLPFVFLYFLQAFDLKSRNSVLKASLSLSLLAVMDIRYVYLFGILIFFYVFYQYIFKKRKNYFDYIKRWISLGGISVVILVLLLSYMIVPILFVQGAALPDTYGRVSQTDFLGFTTMANAMLLLQPHWYKNVFGNLTPLIWYFAVFPIVAFAAPLLHKRNRSVGFWLLIALVGIFLTKGSLEPFGFIYTWMFTHIPGFSLFRDSSKFYVFITLSYAVLAAFTVEGIIRKLRGVNKQSLALRAWIPAYAGMTKIIPLFFIPYCLLITFPVWSNKMTGILSNPRNLNDFYSVEQTLSSDTTFGRVLWIPSRTPLSYADINHPSLEASRLLSMRPFALGVVGSYETFNFLRDAPFIDQLLKITGIQYISYPYPDEKRQTLKSDEKDYYHAFLNELNNSSWSDGFVTEEPFSTIKTKEAKDHFFIATNKYSIIGSDRIYWELSQIPGFDLAKNALSFVEENAVNFNSDNKKIILYNKEIDDLAMDLIFDKKLVFPAKDLPFEPSDTSNGWWKRETADLISWRSFLQDKYGIDSVDFDYGGGWAIAEGDSSKKSKGSDFIVKVQNSRFEKGNILFARVMKSSKGGTIEFWQGDTKIGEITTKDETNQPIDLTVHGYGEVEDKTLTYEDAQIAWFPVGTVLNDSPITIQTTGDLNVINALNSIDQNTWDTAQGEAFDLMQKGNVIIWKQTSLDQKQELLKPNSSPSVHYTRYDSTHYTVSVSGLTQPEVLVFSESYSPLWKMDGIPSTEVYSLLNSFPLEKDGEYEVTFTAQKYVNIGLIISLVTLISSGILLFKKQMPDQVRHDKNS
jgi:hypothetical protein